MGLGLLLLTAGAFLRFVLGRYAGMLGAYDLPGTVLMVLGVIAIALAVVRHYVGSPYVVRRTANPGNTSVEPAPSPAPTGSAPDPAPTGSAPDPAPTGSAPDPAPTGSAPDPAPTDRS